MAQIRHGHFIYSTYSHKKSFEIKKRTNNVKRPNEVLFNIINDLSGHFTNL